MDRWSYVQLKAYMLKRELPGRCNHVARTIRTECADFSYNVAPRFSLKQLLISVSAAS